MTQLPPGPPKDPKPRPAGAAKAIPADTWQDWVTIWQSELNALATDREAQQFWTRLVDIWAARARASGGFLPRAPFAAGHNGSAGRAGTEPPPGAAAAAAAPDAGEREPGRADIDRLARRVEELERRLAELGGDGRG